MFSFVGDTILDPFLGTGTTSLAASKWGRNSIGIEVEPKYHGMALRRLRKPQSMQLSLQYFEEL
jgi:DNA modification methylase